MKKIFICLVGLLFSTGIFSCPPPTHHGILRLGAVYDYKVGDNWSAQNIGMCGTIGWEEKNRYVTISANGTYMPKTKDWSVGGEIAINPLGINYGMDTPINFNIIGGGGYKHRDYKDFGYISVGAELSGRVGLYVAPFARCTYDINLDGLNHKGSVNMQAGFRVWLGRSW